MRRQSTRLIEAAALAGAVAGVATFVAEHPVLGLRLSAASLLIGGLALAVRSRSGSTVRFGFASALTMVMVGSAAAGWSVRDGLIKDDLPSPWPPGSTRTTSPPSTGTSTGSFTLRRQGTIPLTARAEIDLDSEAGDWGVAEWDQSYRADLRFVPQRLEPLNEAQLREAAGDSPDDCLAATASYVLHAAEELPETRYVCVITNEDQFAAVRIDRNDVQRDGGGMSRITLRVAVYQFSD